MQLHHSEMQIVVSAVWYLVTCPVVPSQRSGSLAQLWRSCLGCRSLSAMRSYRPVPGVPSYCRPCTGNPCICSWQRNVLLAGIGSRCPRWHSVFASSQSFRVRELSICCCSRCLFSAACAGKFSNCSLSTQNCSQCPSLLPILAFLHKQHSTT